MRILIADDVAYWRSKLREVVDHTSEIIGEACDGLEAVEKTSALNPDVVILDLSMPRMNGIEAARLIRQRLCSAGIVFLTENTDADIRQEALSIGDAYVLKRNATTELLSAIEMAQAAAASPTDEPH